MTKDELMKAKAAAFTECSRIQYECMFKDGYDKGIRDVCNFLGGFLGDEINIDFIKDIRETYGINEYNEKLKTL